MATYIKIASNTVGAGGVASVTFSSIVSTYTDLVLKASMRSTSANNSLSLQFNGAGVSSSKLIQGNGATAASYSRADFYVTGVVDESAYTANTFSNFELYIPNYASANYKSFSIDGVTENNSTTSYATLVAGIQNSTTAVGSITITPGGGNFAQYSTFTLYGISNA